MSERDDFNRSGEGDTIVEDVLIEYLGDCGFFDEQAQSVFSQYKESSYAATIQEMLDLISSDQSEQDFWEQDANEFSDLFLKTICSSLRDFTIELFEKEGIKSVAIPIMKAERPFPLDPMTIEKMDQLDRLFPDPDDISFDHD